ncbi:MAG: nucleotide sugar dehydrogenase [bacterium]|nr:nucleotide sugar dehydrogenase [bacterium]
MNRNIACIGAGYIGGPTMAVIAQQNPDRKVIVADISQARIDAWNSDQLPIYEPGLEEVVFSCRGKNLFFTTDIAGAIRECDIIFVGVNTPTKTFGKGAGYASNLQYWEAAARTIAKEANRDKIVIEKSTLPIKTADAMAAVLNTHPEHTFTILSNPEFLAEGSAINDLLKPDRVLIGGPQDRRGKAAMKALVDVYATWVPRKKIITTNVWSSEMSKLAANAMLAQRISSVNAFSELCEVTGADIDEVAYVLGMDHRIGKYFLKAGPGFGGSCFKKDVLNLVYLCRSYGLNDAANYWEGVIVMNDAQQRRIVERTVKAMFNTLAGKRIALFGFAFKANTGDTRETPALTVANLLAEEHAHLVVTYPKALPEAKKDLAHIANVVLEEEPYEAAREADAIIVMTEWECYKHLDWEKIYGAMRKPALLFDARNILQPNELKKIGFNVLAIGKNV